MRKCKLGELLKIKHGYAFKSENYVKNSKYALVTLANISGTNNFQFNREKTTYYGADFPDDFILKTGDLIMPLTEQVVGLFGNSAFVPHIDNITFVLNQRVGKVMPKKDKADKYFLHYLLSTQSVREQLEYRASGTRQRNISPDDIYDVEVFVPDYEMQKKIGKALYRLEEKVNNNSRINDELESMAKTIYDYWFLQYEFPNEDGNPYKSSGGKMVWNEELKREIPEGWEVKQLNYHLECNKYTLKSSDKISEIAYLDTSNIVRNNIESVQIIGCEERFPSRAKRIIKENDILFSTVRPEQMHYGLIKKPLSNMIASTAFAVLSAKEGREYNEIFYLYITSDNIINSLNTIANSSVSSYPSINAEDILNLKIALPSDYKQILFAIDKFQSIYNKIEHLHEENKALISLKDFLLPLLMNGQIGFKV